MLRTTPAWVAILLLISILTTAPTAQAQKGPFGDDAIREAVSRHAQSNTSVQIKRVRQRMPCNLKRRLLAGAMIGAATGMAPCVWLVRLLIEHTVPAAAIQPLREIPRELDAVVDQHLRKKGCN